MMAHDENDAATHDFVGAASARGIKRAPMSALKKPEEALELSSLVSATF
jgi:hypothetical protein